MPPVEKIALRRMKNEPAKCLLLGVSILFSMMLIAFFLFFEVETLLRENPAHRGLPIAAFLRTVRSCMGAAVWFLVLAAAITVRIQSRIRQSQNEQVLAVLTSIGASAKQRRRLVTTELRCLYYPAIAAGTLLGAFPGIALGRRFLSAGESALPSARLALIYLLLLLGLILAGILLTTLCVFIPDLRQRRQSAIGRVRGQNEEASTQRHGYRQSNTFKRQSFLRRLAKKSVDYSIATYRKIALSFSISAFYPILALIFFIRIVGVEIVLDFNPYDGVSTQGAVVGVVNELLMFIGGSFVLLTLLGILGAVLMVRLQYLNRLTARKAYLAVGLTETDFRTVMRHELGSLALRSLVYLLIWVLTANAVFVMCVG